MRELKLEELSVEQKIGMVTCALVSNFDRTKESDDFVLELIKNHSLGCLWLKWGTNDGAEFLAKVNEVADYPLLVITDAESGW